MIYSQQAGEILPLPDSIMEWRAASREYYTPDNLWDYIDGSAELFISFGFKRVQTVNYSAPDQPGIIVDIFDMNTAPDAFGVFSCSRYKENQKYGQGCQVSKGVIIFWMDHYYVSIMGYPETEQSAIAIDSLARMLIDEIGTTGPLPPELALLPPNGLDTSSIRYFHHYVWLNSLHFISHDNILNINDHTPAVMARYTAGESKPVVIIVSYPDNRAALKSLTNFRKFFLDNASLTMAYKDDNNGWVGSEIMEHYLILTLKASSREDCAEIINRVISNIKMPDHEK